ncbi:MAG TPA: mechanosensitive ion channel domain-containing protein [Bacteroidales bacterium]|nr:mechanosensitive ion channel domain-containing protein [Bacteroidales bacterium]
MSEKVRFIPLILLFLFFSPGLSFTGQAQDALKILTDTSVQKPETIPLEDISIRSAEVVVTSKKMMESLISDVRIEQLIRINDSSLKILDSLIKAESNVNFNTKNRRFVSNKIALWQRIGNRVDAEKSVLSGHVKSLDKEKYDLENEVILWKNTRENLKDEQPGSSILARIDKLTFMLDSMKNLIQGKSEKLLTALDRTTSMGLLADDQLKKVVKVQNDRTEAIFSRTQPALWEINLSNKENLNIIAPIRQFYQMEIRDLKFYFRSNIPNIVLEGFILCFLIILFQVIKKRIIRIKVNVNSYYQKMLVKILLHPISAALVLGVFSTILVFPNRPLLLRDITILISLIPLILILNTLTPSKLRKYYLLLALLMILQYSYFIYSASHVLYQIGMLSIAIIELTAVVSLFRYFKKHPFKKLFTDRVVKVIFLIHIGFSIVGLISLVVGANILAITILGIVIYNTFAGALLATSTLIVNGLIELLLESKTLKKFNVFRLYGDYITPRVTRLVAFSAFLFWFYAFMDNVNIDRLFIDRIYEFLNKDINIGSASFTLIGIFVFFLVLWLTIVISKMIRIILEEDVLNNLKLAKGLPHSISVLVRYTLITIGLMLAVSAAGMPLDNLTLILGALGVGIGFGLQNIFNNLVSGLILLFERPIQIGDTIEVGQLMGHVKSIGIRSSNVRTFDGAEVIVPNGQLISNEVVNWTLSDQTRRIEVIAGVSYGSNPHRVKELFDKILNEHPDILKDPAPRVLFNDMGESSLDFRLLFWTSSFEEWLRIRSEVIFNIFDTLKAEGIEIPFPQRDLHIRSVDPNITLGKKE